MRLLVTRPAEDARALVATLAGMGHEAAAAALIDIRFLSDAKIPGMSYRAVLVTSANGARALGARPEMARLARLPVFAVGEASARAARDAGFGHVESADGDVAALADLVSGRLQPGGDALLHAAGSVSAGDLKGALEARGFRVERVTLYEAVPPTRLPEVAVAALRSGRLDGILFHSPRTARTFAHLVRDERVEGSLATVTAYCLSRAVADALAGLAFAAVRVAPAPHQAALLELLT